MKESIELHTIGTFRGKEYEMQDLLNGLLEENNRLNNIIDKAIEYINNHTIVNVEEMVSYIQVEVEDLLNILQGSDKE